MSTSALGETVDRWLTSRLVGLRRLAQLRRISVADALLDLLTWQQRGKLEELAPSHVAVPSGSHIAIDYSDPRAPVLAVRLQEVFGLTNTPTICGGRVRLTMHLLSPSQRPVQVTTDLESFWRTSYFDVRKELRGRYPKHHWPEDPLQAEPTRRTKRRSEG
jgi:ATP-dependent helicase HrpB